MSATFDVNELPPRFREAIGHLGAGDEIVLTDGAEPRARVALLAPESTRPADPRTPGLHAGAMVPADDFDAPLPSDFWAGEP